MSLSRKLLLAVSVVVALVVVLPPLASLVAPGMLLDVAGQVSGVIPSDGHVCAIGAREVSALPPRITLEGSWHTCDRGPEDFEEGSFLLDLPTWRVTPYSAAPDSWPYWAVVLSCPPDGEVSFEGRACGVSEGEGSAQLFVGYEVTDRTLGDDVAMIEVTVPSDAEVFDRHGDALEWEDLIGLLREGPPVALEIRRSNDAAIVTRLDLD